MLSLGFDTGPARQTDQNDRLYTLYSDPRRGSAQCSKVLSGVTQHDDQHVKADKEAETQLCSTIAEAWAGIKEGATFLVKGQVLDLELVLIS